MRGTSSSKVLNQRPVTCKERVEALRCPGCVEVKATGRGFWVGVRVCIRLDPYDVRSTCRRSAPKVRETQSFCRPNCARSIWVSCIFGGTLRSGPRRWRGAGAVWCIAS